MKNKRLLSILFLILPYFFFAQHEQDYFPLEKTGSIPASFLIVPSKATKKNMETSKILAGYEAEAYYSKMNYYKAQLLQSGKLYLNNAVTAYVDSVVSRLLLSEPKLKREITIYLTRYTEANAFCFPDGSIFVNIGLISTLDNEHELAFILAHEIAHYAEQHSVKDVKRVAEIEKKEVNIYNKSSSAYRSLKFSRESEFDADSWALQLIAQSGYDANRAINCLVHLKKNESTTGHIDFKKYFENEFFKLDTIWFNKKAVNNNKWRIENENENPVASGKLDDLFQTHPDVDKRLEALKLMARAVKRPSGPERVDTLLFSRIKQISLFENTENNFNEQDYLNAIVNSMILLEKYPDNTFLHAMIAKSLYWLSYYKELNPDKFVINTDNAENGYDLLVLNAIVNEIDLKILKSLAYSYARNSIEKYPGKEQLLFYAGINTENYLGKNAAKNYYRDYVSAFPNGVYSSIVKSKQE